MSQTKVQNPLNIRVGCVVFEAGKDLENMVNLGALRGVEFAETMTKTDVKSDNAGTVISLVSEHKCEVKASMLEISLDNLQLIRGGLDKLEAVPSSLQTKTYTFEEDTYNTDEALVIPFFNSNGSILNVSKVVVSNGTDERELDEAEYRLKKVGNGTILFLENGAKGADGVTAIDSENEKIAVTFSYTPAKYIKFSTGGNTVIEDMVVRLTNIRVINGEEKKFQIIIYKATSGSGLTLSFISDEANDVMTTPVTITGNIDGSRKQGDQLFCIIDEQGVM